MRDDVNAERYFEEGMAKSSLEEVDIYYNDIYYNEKIEQNE